MNKIVKEKLTESLAAVLPITLIVVILSVIVTPMPISTLMLFLVGALMVIIGMTLFSLGTDVSMTPLGDGIGAQLPKSKKISIIVIITFIIGVLITIAEPDLQVLAQQVPSIPSTTLIWTVAVGVGIFLVFGVLRSLLRVSLRRCLILFYLVVFAISYFVPNDFVAIAFDSGGVTTGPMTVPFIMAFGVGLASIRSDKDSQNDSFGMVAMSSVGPILAVLLLGIFYPTDGATYTSVVIPEISDTQDLASQFLEAFPDYLHEVLFALLPVIAFWLVFQLIFHRFAKREMKKIGIGFIYTFLGLTIFLVGVNVGFMPVGHYIGSELSAQHPVLLIVVGMIMGCFIVLAEPAVHVLNKQVETITNGSISQTAMLLSLSIGVAISVGLSMVRVLTGISIYYILIPGYLLALVMTFFVPRIFTGIAFDSGGVASGPMTTTFLLPFAMGACEAIGGDVLTDAFGIVAFVAMTPLITIQALGVFYQFKKNKAEKQAVSVVSDDDDDIIELEEGETE